METHTQYEESGAADVMQPLFEATLAPLRDEEGGAPVPAKTLQDLQWEQLLMQVGSHTTSHEGAELVAGMRPLRRPELARRRLAEIGEYMELLGEGEDAPVYGLRDIRRAVDHAMRGGILVAEDLEAVSRNCDVAARTERFFRNRAARAPLLAALGRQLDPCDELRSALNHAIEPGGRLSDHASPDLRRLRRAVQNHTDRIKSAVDRLLRSDELDPYLQDDYFTVREDRYVLPVRVGAKNTVTGIVHGYSASGQTAFVEPDELVELNNQLRWAQIEVQEEEQRILQRLTALTARYADALRRNTEVLAYLDMSAGIAKFGRDIRGTIPEIVERKIELRQARHPLLYLKLQPADDSGGTNPTVANDVLVDPERRVLIISGPNTGGKTVLLKTVGLCALMARCGIPIPTDEGSSIGFFDAVYTDIGDEQSIERDLSTFSSHLVNINGFLPHCDPNSLVLLDELFAGTDPMQGSALAVSLLEELARRGSTTLITTHLEGLKTLALEDEVFANASMGFDIESLQPTYQLTLGIPGSSFALRIADRLGFPGELVSRAMDVLEGEGKLSVDEVLAKLEDQVEQLRKEQNRLEHNRREAERAREKYKSKYADLIKKEREHVHEETRRLKNQLKEARRLIKSKVKEIEATETVTRKNLESIRQDLQDVERGVDQVREKTEPVTQTPSGLQRVRPDDLEPGMKVYAGPFKRVADVLQFSPGDDEAQVQVGMLKAYVAIEELFYPNESARQRHISGGASASTPPSPSPAAAEGDAPVLQTSANTVDLRGLRVDEALEKLELFLDSAYLAKSPGVFIIHGHGTGALKRAVRGYLPDSRYVRDFRPGGREEGGDGVTIAYLA